MQINCVVSRYKKNVDWVYRLQNINKFCIYDKETPSNPYNIPLNKGHEASVYLKYIIDHYDNLPDYTFFIHDDEYAWHHSGSIIDRYNEAINSNKLYYNINDKLTNTMIDVIQCWTGYGLIEYFKGWYNEHIEKFVPFNSIELTARHRNSAQFLVHKSLITNIPLETYKNLYNWILLVYLPRNYSAMFLEHIWHILFDIYPNEILNKKDQA